MGSGFSSSAFDDFLPSVDEEPLKMTCEQEHERVRAEVADLADRIRQGRTWTGEAIYTALMIAIAPTPVESRKPV